MSNFNPALRNGQYGSIKTEVLDTIREFDVAAVNAEVGANPAGQMNKLRLQLAWLKTDPTIGTQVIAALDNCPFGGVSNGKIAVANARANAAEARVKELEAKYGVNLDDI